MVVVSYQIAAATLAANYDIMSAQPFLDFATAKFPRRLRRIHCTGGAAIADLVLQVKYGAREVANGIFNTKTGVDIDDTADGFHIVDTDILASDEPLIITVTDAGSTNPYFIKLEIDSA